MSGLDLREPKELEKRNKVFVDVYEHDSDLEQLNNLDHGLKARVVIRGWDKLVSTPTGKELYQLKSDPDDQHNLSDKNQNLVQQLSVMLDSWLETTPPLR
jgi:uncharacterized sulfatase